MSLVAVEISPRPQADQEEIEFVDDLDALSGTEVMLGCGNDNPY